MADAVATRPKRRQNSSSVDRLSELPEPLISSILSSIPTKDAVATSVLSRSWRFRWTTATSLHFEHFGENLVRGDMYFEDFINEVLLNNNESIDKFILRWDSEKLPQDFSGGTRIWTNVAISQHVRVLELDSSGDDGTLSISREYYLPSTLYTCGTLEVLRLIGPFLIRYLSVVSLPKLAEMVLKGVIYESDECFHKLISSCRALESLTVVRKSLRDNLLACSISSPVLKRLFIFFVSGWGGKESSKLRIDAPALEDLSLEDFISWHISIQAPLLKKAVFDCYCLPYHRIVESLQDLCCVESLRLGSYVMRTIEGTTLPTTLTNFKRLVTLYMFTGLSPPRWSCLMDLLDCFVNLEEFVLDVRGPVKDRWRDPDCVPRCLSSSLKRIAFKGIGWGLKKEMPMVVYFLDHGLRVEKLSLTLNSADISGAKQMEIQKKVLSELSRVEYPSCEILLAWENYS